MTRFLVGVAAGAVIAGVWVRADAEARIEAVRRRALERHPSAREKSLASAWEAGRAYERRRDEAVSAVN